MNPSYLCWQSGSILPGIIMHLIHNAIGVLATARPELFEWTGVQDNDGMQHLPVSVLAVGAVVFVLGLTLATRSGPRNHPKRASAVETLGSG